MNTDTARAAYRTRLSALCDVGASVTTEFVNARVRDLVSEKTDAPTPADFLEAIEVVLIPCGRCAGTGKFITHVMNGVPRGPGGPCFRCGGKGAQNYADTQRNAKHDRHYVPQSVSL